MSDMRLVVTGAAGRMGRTLVKAIDETPGVTLVGALERAGRAGAGRRTPARSPGLPPLGVAITDDPLPLLRRRRRHRRFLRARRDGGTRRARGAGAHRPCDRHDRALSEIDGAKLAAAARHAPIVRSGNMSLGVNLLAGARAARGEGARRGVRHRDRRDASPHEGRRAFRHGADARRGGGGRARHRPRRRMPSAAATASPARAERGAIGFASLRGGGVIGDHSVIFAGDGERITLSHQAEDRALVRARRAEGGALGARPQAGALCDGGRAGALGGV